VAANHQVAEPREQALVQRWVAVPSQVDSPAAGSWPALQQVAPREQGAREVPSRPELREQPERRAGPSRRERPAPVQQLAREQRPAAPGCRA